MTQPVIHHLRGISCQRMRTSRLETELLTSGPESGEPVLFLHGNLSSGTFWEETMLQLPPQFRAWAPDQRGYGRSAPEAHIDATRGFGDWADDVAAIADTLKWNQFHLVAHSLGGCVAWAVIGHQSHRIRSATLVAPGPPCGFGGARGPRGDLNWADGAGSGAALVHPEFTSRLSSGQRDMSHDMFSPRAMMNRLYWKPPFQSAREEDLLTAMLQVHLGPRQFPGDWVPSPNWPGFAPGRFGPINAISPRYNQAILPQLLAADAKPPLLWVYGAADAIITDTSISDAGTQGQLGLRPDWPGASIFPPQPYLSQVRFALDEYEKSGGQVQRLIMPEVGHTPYLERPDDFRDALVRHLTGTS